MTPDGVEGGGPASPSGDDLVLSIEAVRAQPAGRDGELSLQIETNRGSLTAILTPYEGSTGCAVFVGGASGGVDGPADRVYRRLAADLLEHGITSLRVDYRLPNELEECVLDALAGCSVLRGLGAERAVLVGHSFGGAVAIRAGGLAPLIGGVAALSSQRFGTAEVHALGKPLLLIHGEDDEVLLPDASRDIFERAGEPKRLVLLPGTGHSLREASAEVRELLLTFITDVLGGSQAAGDRP